MRVPKRIRAVIKNAAELTGASVNQFILHSAFKEAQRMLESESIIKLSTAQTKKMIEAIDNPGKPNKLLRAALKDFRKNVRA